MTLPRWSVLTFDGRLIVLHAATRRDADRAITARGLAAMSIRRAPDLPRKGTDK